MTSAAAEPFLPKVNADTVISVRFDKKEDAVPPRFGIGYWSIRGLGAPLRMMLCAAKVNHEIYMHDLVEDGDSGWKSEYFTTKKELKEKCRHALVNLPYVVDREQRRLVCQSNVCFAHMGRAIGMFGRDEIEASKCEELLCEIYDLRDPFIRFVYYSDASAEEAKKCFAKASGVLKKLNHYLEIESKDCGTDHEDKKQKNEGEIMICHLVGGKFSAPDFSLYELLDQYSLAAKKLGVSDDFLGDYPYLKAFKKGFEELEENQFYLKSWLHTGLPFNNVVAACGSDIDVGVYKRGQAADWRAKGEITMDGSE